MAEARENIMQAIAEYLEMLYFDECPEEWGDRPSMHEVEAEPETAEAVSILKTAEPVAHPDCVGMHGTFFDYSPEPKSKPQKPTFASRIKSAFAAIFRRNATV